MYFGALLLLGLLLRTDASLKGTGSPVP